VLRPQSLCGPVGWCPGPEPGFKPVIPERWKTGNPDEAALLDAPIAYRNKTINGSAGVAAPALSIILNSLPSLRSTIRS